LDIARKKMETLRNKNEETLTQKRERNWDRKVIVTGLLEESTASIITRGNGSNSILANIRICLPEYTTSSLRTILSSQTRL
jgi:hypothetical protein